MGLGSESDETLMGKVAAGQRDCLAPLVRRFASPLLTFLLRMSGDRHRSEDLVQEVFLRVWSRRRTYRFPRPFRPWLYAIAMNVARGEFRRRRLPVVMADDPEWSGPMAQGGGPAETAIDTEIAGLVALAVEKLPARQRAVLALRVWNGLSYAEIAQTIGSSEPTVRSHMHHALAALRRFLEPRLR